MKKYHLILFASLLFSFGFIKADKLIITPGSGYQNLSVGMDMKECIKVLGKASAGHSKQKEKEEWEEFGYKTDKAFLFQLPFDEVYEFPENDYALWKVYTRNHKVICLNISLFNVSKKASVNIITEEGVKFGDSYSKVKKLMGPEHIQKTYGADSDDLLYLRKGIVFVIGNEKVSNFMIFEKMSEERTKEIEDRISE